MRRLIFLNVLFLATSSCGGVQNFPTWKRDSHNQNGGVLNETPVTPVVGPETVVFAGSVSGAFDIHVDGLPYADIEDFYTETERTLPSRVRQAGYDETWSVRLDAAIGFADLWRDMIVYLSPAGDSGFQGQTRVDGQGSFFLAIPARGLGQVYRVRANKRINLLLTRGEERRRVCYNFSAVERSVTLSETSLPVVLDTFESSITGYDCTAHSLDGLTVPPADRTTP